MGQIKTHDPKGENKAVVEHWDDEDAKGVHHKYRLSVNHAGNNQEIAVLKFQNDSQAGQNGVTDAALLAVLIDRIENRLKDKASSSRELALVRTKLEEAMFWLLKAEGK
jgi:hypothetical protein